MKKLFTICSIWILFTVKVDSLSIPFLSQAQSLISLVTDISDLATGRHDLTAGNLFKKKTDASLIAVNKLSEQISELTQSFNIKMDKLMTAVLEDAPRFIQLNNLMQKLLDYTSRIDELYEDYLFYISEFGGVTRHTIEGFGRVVTSHKFGDVPDILRQTYYLLFPGQTGREEDSLLEVMVSSLESTEEEQQCNNRKTNQQKLYDLYETIIISEIKGFTMSSYAYGLLAIYRNSSFDAEMERVTTQTIKRCIDYLSSIHNALKNLKRDIFLCDPPQHIKGETSVELNSITRVVIAKSMFGTCWIFCHEVNHTDFQEGYDVGGPNYWWPAHPCQGRMHTCENIGTTSFCELPPEYDRRYSWVNGHTGGLLGKMDDCYNGTIRQLKDTGSWIDCATCLCQCSDYKAQAKTLRTISLRPQLADIDNNMIVTGVRFEQKDMMIHVQIEQGKLLSAGQIEKSSIQWKELEDFKYLEEGDEGKFVKINGDDEENLEHGTDYQFIHEGQRDVYLDNVYSQEDGYVVTGLKMSRNPRNSKAVQLDVHITPLNSSTGLLEPTDDNPSKWITNKDMPGHDRPFTDRKDRNVTDLRRGDDSYDNVPYFDLADFSKIFFAVSSKWTDAGQSTVPLFDRQTAAPSVRVPLIGVSLLYRATKESSGFLGFRLRTANLYDFVNSDLDPDTAKQYLNSIQEIMDSTMPELE